MAFRAGEATADGYESLKTYLIPRNFSAPDRARSEEALMGIVKKYGPVVETYPTWHPLVRNHDGRNPENSPSERCGYKGLDHTRFLAHGFITCPYHGQSDVIDAVDKFPSSRAAIITAEALDIKFYNENATPVFVRCDWADSLELGNLVPKKFAVPLMLEQELPCWHWSHVGETWETMRPYLLGKPHGNRSSLFVSQDTALALKKLYLAMAESGMFGPIRVG